MEEQYFIINTSRAQGTRATRALKGSWRGKAVRFVCGGTVRLTRGRPRPVSKELLMQHHKEIFSLVGLGQIEVRCGSPFGSRVAGFKEPEEEEDAAVQEVKQESSVGEAEQDETPKPGKPLDKMNKSELINYCSQVSGIESEELETLTKKEILEIVKGES